MRGDERVFVIKHTLKRRIAIILSETTMTEPGLDKFGAFVERMRCGKRWSQNQLGKLIGVRSSYITSMEGGETWPSDHVIDQIAILFGVPHEYLEAMLGPKPQRDAPRPFVS